MDHVGKVVVQPFIGDEPSSSFSLESASCVYIDADGNCGKNLNPLE